jgi:hypothetical protein
MKRGMSRVADKCNLQRSSLRWRTLRLQRQRRRLAPSVTIRNAKDAADDRVADAVVAAVVDVVMMCVQIRATQTTPAATWNPHLQDFPMTRRAVHKANELRNHSVASICQRLRHPQLRHRLRAMCLHRTKLLCRNQRNHFIQINRSTLNRPNLSMTAARSSRFGPLRQAAIHGATNKL